MAYVKPQVLVYQEFASTATSQDTVLRPWIVGRLANIHENGSAVVAEDYWDIKDNATTTRMPDMQPGSEVDKDSVVVNAKDAILCYKQILAPAETPEANDTETQWAHSVSGKPNQLEFHNFNVKENGDNQRDGSLGERDVTPGDIVRVSARVAANSGYDKCKPVSLVTKVIGCLGDTDNGVIGDVVDRTDYKNTDEITLETGLVGTYTGTAKKGSFTITVTPGENSNPDTYTVTTKYGSDPVGTTSTATTCPTIDEGTYTYTLADGLSYTTATAITGSKTVSFTNASLTVIENKAHGVTLTLSGEYDPKVSGLITQVFKVQVTDINKAVACQNVELRVFSSSGLEDNYTIQAVTDVNDSTKYSFTIVEGVTGYIAKADVPTLEIGDYWQCSFKGAYNQAGLTKSGTYTGDEDDTYVISCVKGGFIGATGSTAQVTIHTLSGSEFIGPITPSTEVIETAYGVRLTFASGDLALGATFTISCESGKDGPVKKLVLRDSLPEVLRTVGSAIIPVNVELCVRKDVRIDHGWSLEGDQITIPSNWQVTDSDFRKTNGTLIPLVLLDGTITVDYREWLFAGAGQFNYVRGLDEVADIPGPLSPENPVKYAVYKAITNSGSGTAVYTTVTGDSADAWSEALAVASGSREIYTVVPLTQDLEILKIAETLVLSDSNEETCAWKNGFFSVAAPANLMLVGQSKGDLHPTSTDGKVVKAKMDVAGVVEIVSRDAETGLANVDLSQVQPGDVMRVYVDGQSFVPYIINSVSGDIINVLNPKGVSYGYSNANSADEGPRIEVWHTMTRNEQVEYIAGIAQSFANRRIKLVWPDIVGDAGKEVSGMYLCAALAGLVGGSLPNQGLTRVTVSGFDDLSRSTPYFTEAQIKQLASAGVWIVVEDLDGTIFTMHGLTTNTATLQYSEEMITRIVDFLSFELRNRLERYIGVTNVTTSTIDSIRDEMSDYLNLASASNYNANGEMVTDFEILDVAQDVLLKDRINVIVSVTIPKATNNIVLRIQAE